MYFSGNNKKEQMFNLLVMKTRELGRQVTFAEADGDDRLPKANDYAYYYGEFANAAEEALRYVKYHKEDENSGNNEQSPKGVVILSKKDFKPLDEGRKKAVMDELVEMFIKNGCKMPTSRMIKKNRYIRDEEVDALRRSGDFTEHKLRKLAGERFAPEPAEEPKVVEEPKAVEESEVAEEPEIAPEEQETDVLEATEVAESTPEVVEAAVLEEEPEEAAATPVEVSEALDESEPESTEVSESESDEELGTDEELETDEVSEEEPVLEDEPKVVALPVEEPETKEEVSEMVDEKKTAIRYTSKECFDMLREACLQAGHVLTQYEAKQLSSVGKLPAWVTLQRQVGPWYTWDELFSVPFASENAERIAQERKKQAEEPPVEEPAKEERQLETPVAPEEAFEPEDESDGEFDDGEDYEYDEESETSEEDENAEVGEVQMIELPITITYPSWAKGNITINLEL